MAKPLASLSLDLDNQWSYLKTHGDKGWETFPSYLNVVVPRVLHFLAERDLQITFFIVGQDAALTANHAALRSIAEAGHEIGNHSFHHEPWLHLYTPADVAQEIDMAENSILAATDQRPIGFRGPGFSISPDLLAELTRRDYLYDGSTLPMFLGPLARLYYFFTAKLTPQQKVERKRLFGTLREGFRPLRPYLWNTPAGSLIEIPVTTMPLFKLPIHVSYLIYLAHYSRSVARAYWRFTLFMCQLFGVEPSLLLHPLDFLGKEDKLNLDFFPGMSRSAAWKITFVADVIQGLQDRYQIVPMKVHAQAVSEALLAKNQQ